MTWLADVKGRCEAATAGPWRSVQIAHANELCSIEAPEETLGHMTKLEDSNFACAARTDLPRCIAWIERAKAAFLAARQYVEGPHYVDEYGTELDEEFDKSPEALAIIDTLLSELEQA